MTENTGKIERVVRAMELEEKPLTIQIRVSARVFALANLVAKQEHTSVAALVRRCFLRFAVARATRKAVAVE